jgi:hypothetical protein
MVSWLLTLAEPLRWAVLVLCALNLLWALPAAWRGVRGNLSAECGFAIAWAGILLGTAGFQLGAVTNRIPSSDHWIKSVDLALVALGLLIALVARNIRALELERRYGQVTMLRRLLRGVYG